MLCAAPGGVDYHLLNNVAREAGAYVACSPGLLCEVNGVCMSLHSCHSGKYEVRLPRKVAVVRDAFSGEVIARKTDVIELDMPAWNGKWLLFF